MNPALQQLKDIHLPSPLSAWQLAPGWMILFLSVCFMATLLIYYFYHRRRKKAVVVFALKQLKRLQNLTSKQIDQVDILVEISELIRRTSLHYFQRDKIAGLSGQAWLEFLNQSGKTTQFKSPIGELLIRGQYQKSQPVDLAPLFALTKQWLMTMSKMSKQKEMH